MSDLPIEQRGERRSVPQQEAQISTVVMPGVRPLVSRRAVKMKKVPHLPLCVITWEDHSSIDAWQGHEEAQKSATPKIITSCGWLHHETDKVYSLVAAIADDSDVACQQLILKSATVDFFPVPAKGNKKKRAPSTAHPVSPVECKTA